MQFIQKIGDNLRFYRLYKSYRCKNVNGKNENFRLFWKRKTKVEEQKNIELHAIRNYEDKDLYT